MTAPPTRTGTGEQIASRGGLTGAADTTTIANRVAIDLAVAPVVPRRNTLRTHAKLRDMRIISAKLPE